MSVQEHAQVLGFCYVRPLERQPDQPRSYPNDVHPLAMLRNSVISCVELFVENGVLAQRLLVIDQLVKGVCALPTGNGCHVFKMKSCGVAALM